MKILIISTAFNGMTQRIHQELILDKHHVSVELAINDEHMLEAVTLFSPDIIICPFLTKRIPKVIWKNTPCLIVHPGIEGDRGPSSIDWAIMEAQYEWGVTLLQASEEMDAGDIWESSTFPLRRNSSKSSTYRSEVIQSAAKLVRCAVNKFVIGDVAPRPLNYKNEHVKGTLKPIMRQDARGIDWQTDNTETVLKKLNASDSCPGVLINLEGINVYAFGASPEIDFKGMPGSLIATHYDSICLATVDGAVWIKQLKLKPAEMKLPATLLLKQLNVETTSQVPDLLHPNYSPNYYADEISIRTQENIAYLYFDFYNGAMDTRQCNRLKDAFNTLKVTDAIDVIVLMGGEQFWSNGIHLKVIEANSDPADESWKNINAINDLIYEILTCEDKITVAAIRSNAGAGGAMMALACDKVVLRDGVVLNPHYKSMGLYGSEYWTYTLPHRVGSTLAEKLTSECLPILASQAHKINFSDELFDEDVKQFHQQLESYCNKLANRTTFKNYILTKKIERQVNESIQPLAVYREQELQEMYRCFFDMNSRYHIERKHFVYKRAPSFTPRNIATHRVDHAFE